MKMDKELEQMLHSSDFEERLYVARQGYGLDILVNDEEAFVRMVVAGKGYGLSDYFLDFLNI